MFNIFNPFYKKIIATIIVFSFLYLIYLLSFLNKENLGDENLGINISLIPESEARRIAEKSCIKGGIALGKGIYNGVSKAWSFDANLNSTKPGCSSKCVVDEYTRNAEIKWDCEEMITPSTVSCGIENCHGMDIVCGENKIEVCTMMYQIGDKCREYASCGVVDGKCKQIVNNEFSKCKSCVEKCINDYKDSPSEQFTCESKC